METVVNNRPAGVMAFLRGDIQEDLEALHSEVREDIGRLAVQRQAFLEGDRQVVTEVIREIMAGEAPETGLDLSPLIDEARFGGGFDHMHMPLLELAAQARIPAWLHGEAGSGKSTAAERIAEKSGLEFRSISLCPTTSKSDLLGYRDANGKYNTTAFRDVYENGGVFLFDEIDNAHPSSLALVNNALSNNEAEFPDEKVEKHQDAIIVAAANTIGKGATAQYVGRAVIDAATRDRFVFIPWDIDESLEDQIVLGKSKRSARIDVGEGGTISPKEWLHIVREKRGRIDELGIRQLCSPRAAIFGAQLAKLGMGQRWIEELCIYKGMPEHDRVKIEGRGW